MYCIVCIIQTHTQFLKLTTSFYYEIVKKLDLLDSLYDQTNMFKNERSRVSNWTVTYIHIKLLNVILKK